MHVDDLQLPVVVLIYVLFIVDSYENLDAAGHKSRLTRSTICLKSLGETKPK